MKNSEQNLEYKFSYVSFPAFNLFCINEKHFLKPIYLIAHVPNSEAVKDVEFPLQYMECLIPCKKGEDTTRTTAITSEKTGKARLQRFESKELDGIESAIITYIGSLDLEGKVPGLEHVCVERWKKCLTKETYFQSKDEMFKYMNMTHPLNQSFRRTSRLRHIPKPP